VMVMWKIMAGRGSAFVDRFIDDSRIAIGWAEAGDYTHVNSREDIIKIFLAVWPEQSQRQIKTGASQVFRFLHEMSAGDKVVVYDPDERIYHVGRVLGEPKFDPEWNERLPVNRDVEWIGNVNRDDLSQPTKNTLGALMTLFKLSDIAEKEINSTLTGEVISKHNLTVRDDIIQESIDPFSDITNIAFERVKDQILSLEWDDMQELVAALLRALGYRTIVSPRGADRGRDIVASRDGFGFERPRIVVEVKHRTVQIGAPQVRSFLSVLHAEDRGLYVGTGGFSKEAYYTAENANNVTHLMTIDGLADALLEQYEALDEVGRRLLPMIKLYWPA
jgi:restriction system protein